jgi:hypothetical protein
MVLYEQVQVPRAQRFPFQIPLHYRRSGTPEWHACETVNISRTGILFQTDETLPINSNLDIRVQFPSEVTLSCQGSVVRASESACAVHMRHSQISGNGK